MCAFQSLAVVDLVAHVKRAVRLPGALTVTLVHLVDFTLILSRQEAALPPPCRASAGRARPFCRLSSARGARTGP